MLLREDTLQILLDFERSPTLFRANKTTGQLQQQQYLGFMGKWFFSLCPKQHHSFVHLVIKITFQNCCVLNEKKILRKVTKFFQGQKQISVPVQTYFFSPTQLKCLHVLSQRLCKLLHKYFTQILICWREILYVFL